jgi:hypothetical protein
MHAVHFLLTTRTPKSTLSNDPDGYEQKYAAAQFGTEGRGDSGKHQE